jgi:pre-mRNA-splicing factor 18
MDFLKAEIAAKKRKAVSPEGEGGGEKESKYVRRGEEERKREEEYRANDLARRAAKADKVKEKGVRSIERQGSHSATPETGSPGVDGKVKAIVSDAQKEVFNISTSEAIRRLRSKGEPIRLFGESDKERRLRLRALELIEERGEKVGQNDFMRVQRVV